MASKLLISSIYSMGQSSTYQIINNALRKMSDSQIDCAERDVEFENGLSKGTSTKVLAMIASEKRARALRQALTQL